MTRAEEPLSLLISYFLVSVVKLFDDKTISPLRHLVISNWHPHKDNFFIVFKSPLRQCFSPELFRNTVFNLVTI